MLSKEQCTIAIGQYLTVNDMKEEEFLKRYGFVYWGQGNSLYDLLNMLIDKDVPKELPFTTIDEVADHWVEVFSGLEDDIECVNAELRTLTKSWDDNFTHGFNSPVIG